MFGFTLLRTARVAEMHKRIRDLRQEMNDQRDEAVSYRQVTIQQSQQIEALEKKCDIVGVSAMKNQIEAIRRAAHDTNGLFKVLEILGEKKDGQEMRDNELREAHREQDGVLQRPLAPSASGTETEDHGGARDEGQRPEGVSER